MEPFQIIWDLEDDRDGNYWHVCVENGVTPEEFSEVLLHNTAGIIRSKSSGRPMTFGWTSTGKHLAIIWEDIEEDPWSIYPVTAYPVEPSTREKST